MHDKHSDIRAKTDAGGRDWRQVRVEIGRHFLQVFSRCDQSTERVRHARASTVQSLDDGPVAGIKLKDVSVLRHLLLVDGLG